MTAPNTEGFNQPGDLAHMVAEATLEYFQNLPGLRYVIALIDIKEADFRVAAVGDSAVLVDFPDIALPGGQFHSPTQFMNTMFNVLEIFRDNNDTSEIPTLLSALAIRNDDDEFPLSIMGIEPPADTDPLLQDGPFGDLALSLVRHAQSELEEAAKK